MYPNRRRGRIPALWGSPVAGCLLWFVVAGSLTPGVAAEEFRFPGFDRTYRDLAADPEPIPWGLFQVRLTSPDAHVTVLSHRVVLSPAVDGTHAYQAEVQFSGAGVLTAEIQGMGLSTRQTDEVALPQQIRTQDGRVRIERAREGYRVTLVQSPPTVSVAVRSRLAGGLVAWCRSLPLVGGGEEGCRGLERALSQLSLPMPAAGETALIPYSEFTPAERARLDRYLDARAGGG